VTDHVNVPSSGKTTQYRPQGELVASVIQSDHKISRNYEPSAAVSDAPMFTVKDVTTVQQLIDLSAFLQDAYDIRILRTL
jgi:hypothetical protein